MRCIVHSLTRRSSFILAVALAAVVLLHTVAHADEQVVTASAIGDVEVTVAAETADAMAAATPLDRTTLATPTHHQTGLIKANADGLPERQLSCFCLTPDNRIVAGCASGEGELRVFDDQGKYLESWSAPFQPEAIYVRGDGKIFLAGAGQLARLSSDGNVELQQKSPHADSMAQNLDKIRADVVEQNKRQAEVYVQQSEQYEELLKQVDQQVADFKKQLADIDAAESDPQLRAAKKLELEPQLAVQEQMKTQYEEIKKQWDEMAAQNKPKELSEAEIDQLVKDSINYKTQVSSISATDDNVYLATRAAVGYGFGVWKMDADFAGGKQIVSELSGCCGQMDVKANANGLFVAENSKHRVCRFDHDGKLICNWGQGARSGIEGFGSCCNPMNVAFGPDDVVYTAEDNTGRIKRYSPDGKLLGLVGSVELVPGCKNCSIAVSSDGTRVYMLDITRGHIVKMEPYAPGEAPAPSDEDLSGSPSVGGAIAKGFLKVLGY
jgi:hypothetical protein